MRSVHAPAPSPISGTTDYAALAASSGSILGLVPHQLRGFLAQFRTLPIVGAAYDRCTGCSETVRFHSLSFIRSNNYCIVGAQRVREGWIRDDVEGFQRAQVPRTADWAGQVVRRRRGSTGQRRLGRGGRVIWMLR